MTDKMPKTILSRSVVKKTLQRVLVLAAIIILVYGSTAVIYATKTIYKVKINYAVVLERFLWNQSTPTS
jgi:hypothetical protein